MGHNVILTIESKLTFELRKTNNNLNFKWKIIKFKNETINTWNLDWSRWCMKIY